MKYFTLLLLVVAICAEPDRHSSRKHKKASDESHERYKPRKIRTTIPRRTRTTTSPTTTTMAPPPPAPGTCRTNELFDTCAPLTVPTCADPNPVPSVSGACSPGCKCLPMYVRNAVGACVHPSQCSGSPDQPCGPNELSTPCIPSVVATCANPNPAVVSPPVCPQPPPSTLNCMCMIGFLRNAAGACVMPTDCP